MTGKDSQTKHFLIVGLGNYTHPKTRHSVGQVVLDSLAERFQVPLSYDRSVNGWVGNTEIDILPPPQKGKGKGKQAADAEPPEPQRVKFTFLKPKLLMNVSGKSVALTLRNKIRPSTNGSIIVLHDSLEQKPLKISPKYSGSANGHNGVRSTIDSLAGQDFHRIRLGIGRGAQDVGDFVLEPLPPKELLYWDGTEADGVSEVWKAVEAIVASAK
ncbi:hypothetical protein FRC01_012576 [Tulasnella sp. 417]|nr:hypothetical protein FRC01_012576 [Tulasnella sp. 417]